MNILNRRENATYPDYCIAIHMTNSSMLECTIQLLVLHFSRNHNNSAVSVSFNLGWERHERRNPVIPFFANNTEHLYKIDTVEAQRPSG